MKKLIVSWSFLFCGILVSSENNQKAWCDGKDNRNDQVEQWVTSQVAFNRIKVLEQQVKGRSVSTAKKEKKR